MSSTLITQYPLWFLIFCLLTGFLYAFFLYRKDTKLEEAKKIAVRVMFALRFLSVSLIAFLLLSPIIKSISRTIENPIIIFAQDNSESVKKEAKEGTFSADIKALKSKIESKYKVISFSYGEKVKKEGELNFNDKQTDISELIEDIKNNYFNKNVGALILSGDGIFNKGINPLYNIEELNFPVYTLAMGDTTVKKDIAVSNVSHNKIAFLNNKFPVQVSVSARKLRGKKTILKLTKEGKLLASEQIIIDSDNFFKKYNFEIKAEKTGIQNIKIQIVPVEGENNTKNNYSSIAVEVIDSKQKILILANSPHPDISALRQALLTNKNFETEYYTIDDFNKNIKEYNLVILHQLPSERHSAVEVLKSIANANLPVLYILGTQSSKAKFNALQTGLRINKFNKSFDDVQAVLNDKFTLFELGSETENFMQSAPPLKSPFGEYILNTGAEILFHRKINNIQTNQALFVFNPNSTGAKNKNAVITGEGIWRWRISDYNEHKNHNLFNELINKTVQYLTLKVNKDRFRVYTEKLVSENDEIIFTAETYNKSYEAVTETEVKLQVTDSAGKSIDYVLNKAEKSYYLNLGNFNTGKYKWKAETVLDGKKKTKSGVFNVSSVNVESVNTIADHNLLFRIANQTGGQMFYKNQHEALADSVLNNPNIVPISYTEKKTESIVNWKWLFFIILGLLSAEWFMRKFNGAY